MTGRLIIRPHANAMHGTRVMLRDDGTVGEISKVVSADFDNKDVGAEFLSWLRAVDKETQMKVFAAIVLEYQVSAHINTKTEEDQLAALNMQQDDVIPEILQAVRTVAFVDHERHVARVADVTAYLSSQHLLLPPYVVHTVMKTIEECVPGNCRQIDDDLFELRNNF